MTHDELSGEDQMLEEVICGARSEADPAWQAAVQATPELAERLERLRDLSGELDEVARSEVSELDRELDSRRPTLQELVRTKSDELVRDRGVDPEAAQVSQSEPSMAHSTTAGSWLPKLLAAAALLLLALSLWRPWEGTERKPIFMQPGDVDARFAVTETAAEGVLFSWQLELPIGGKFELSFYDDEEALDPFFRVPVGTASSWTPSPEQLSLFPDSTWCKIDVLDVQGKGVDSASLELQLRR